jgi:hypothetical protein
MAANPVAVTIDAAGMLYGTTEYGGTSNFQYCGGGCGTAFELTSSGNETVLHSFSEPPGDGIFPQAGVIAYSKSLLYGTTTVYQIANGIETLHYSFTGGTDGALPSATLLWHGGVLYGTATLWGR